MRRSLEDLCLEVPLQAFPSLDQAGLRSMDLIASSPSQLMRLERLELCSQQDASTAWCSNPWTILPLINWCWAGKGVVSTVNTVEKMRSLVLGAE